MPIDYLHDRIAARDETAVGTPIVTTIALGGARPPRRPKLSQRIFNGSPGKLERTATDNALSGAAPPIRPCNPGHAESEFRDCMNGGERPDG
jgi:hypothetical protein